MIHRSVWIGVLALLACSGSIHSQDDDDEIKGPLMPLKPDGSLMTTAELIKEFKHVPEVHMVTTGDGYKLTVFRVVPAEVKQKAPVILQHGYMTSSDCWVTDPNALAFKLSDAGFDVWISNSRGNAYSKEHTKLKPDNKAFWDFSWHEMGAKDLPAVIDFVLEKTGQKHVHYVGHSMGTTMSFVLTSTMPEYNGKLKSLVGLAPVAFLSKLKDMVGPEGMVEDMAKKYMTAFKDTGKVEVFPRKDQATNSKMQITCEDVEENMRDMCKEKMEEMYAVLGGAYLPAGSSYKTMDHFYQMAVEGVMKHYKYDKVEENQKAYGSDKPPAYTDKFKQITAPVLFWSAAIDQLLTEKDTDDLKAILPNVVADNRITDECFDHVAFLFPRKKSCTPVRAKVYSDIVEAISKMNN